MVTRARKPSAQQSDASQQNGDIAIPQHVAIIMDGSGRWARQRGLSRQAGHRAGTENIRRVIQSFAEHHVSYLTLYAFSTENWKRPRTEVNALLRLLGRVIEKELMALHDNNVRLLHLGSLAPLSNDLQRRVEDAVELTKENTGLTVQVAFNYGGRAEIAETARRIVEAKVPPEKIDEALFESYINPHHVPDPDLVVRTAGEMRLSNFLIWQAAYAEYYFTPAYWPDFDEPEIVRALEAYSNRVRRFGAVVEGPAKNGKTGNGAHPSA